MEWIEQYIVNFDWYYTNYLTFGSRLLLVFVYLPVLVIVSFLIYRRLNWKRRLKIPVVISFLIIAYFAPVVDVMKTGLDMQYYCKKEHGLHVYKAVSVKGIFGVNQQAKKFLGMGFEYLEKEVKGKLYRFELVDGELDKFEIRELSSLYEGYFEDVFFDSNMRLITYGIRNRHTREIIAESKFYQAGGGWLDHLLPSFGPIIFNCNSDHKPGIGPLVKSALTPLKGG